VRPATLRHRAACHSPATRLPLACHSPATLLPLSCHSPATLLPLALHSPATLRHAPDSDDVHRHVRHTWGHACVGHLGGTGMAPWDTWVARAAHLGRRDTTRALGVSHGASAGAIELRRPGPAHLSPHPPLPLPLPLPLPPPPFLSLSLSLSLFLSLSLPPAPLRLRLRLPLPHPARRTCSMSWHSKTAPATPHACARAPCSATHACVGASPGRSLPAKTAQQLDRETQ
jgi:hypothetical protein